MITAERLATLATRGPRYTSYPPATELSTIVETEVLTELARKEPVSLYLHVPFCKQLCWYCGCNVVPTRDASRGDRFADVLATELAILGGRRVEEIAFGGGSPNFLSPATLQMLVTAIERYFEVSPDARRSVELDPRETTYAHLEMLARLGFRSLSVGVQDLASKVQDAIHRYQSQRQTRWLIETARYHGFDDLNVDIVYGLPHQTEESFATTLDHVIGFAPDRIALFGYAHLPQRFPHQRNVERAGRVLDQYERATLLLAAIEKLTSAGYLHIGLDHFAKPHSALARAAGARRMTRTFQGYVPFRAETILGAGPSAISSSPRVIWQSHVDLAAWESSIAEARLPIARGVRLDRDDQIRAAVITRLMCDGELDFTTIEREFAIDARTYFARELTDLPAELASYEHGTLRTTETGRLLVRNVCMRFDRYLEAGARFSTTI
ncbi:MAG TPA: oxygen-independent coproporphyrinogen III oxidase [Kofleriaceae bacterium]